MTRKPKRKRGRPRLDDAEKARRGTLRRHRIKGPRRTLGEESRSRAPRDPRDYLGIARGYMADVLAGRIIVGKWARLAVERQRRDLERAESDPSWPYVFSDEHAIDFCEFAEHCPHVEGKWPTPTIELQPWQVFIHTTEYGWRHRDDLSRRRFTVFYTEVGRKNAKSTLAAIKALFHLLREGEVGAQVVCGATTGTQARIVFNVAQRMVRTSSWLRSQRLQAFANAIISRDGSMKPINAKSSTQDGLNPSAIILDESHAQDFGLHDVLRSAQGARSNELLHCPTSAGYDLLSVGYALRGTVQKVLEGIFESDHTFGTIYAIDEGDSWRDETVWPKANPGLGISPRLDWVRKYCADAQQTQGMEGEFRTKCCGEWLQSSSSWLNIAHWDACAEPTLKLEQFLKARCWIGADLAQIDDIAALALVFERDDVLYGFVKLYLPRHVVEERARRVPAYAIWADSGILTLTDSPLTDFNIIEDDIRALCKLFDVRAIVFDQFSSAQISARLATDGLPAIVEPKTAKTFTPAARELEGRVIHRRFRHDGNSCLRWMASNCVVTRKIDDSILPKKESAESPNKIDGIDALLLAIGAKLREPVKPEPSYAMFTLTMPRRR